MSLTQMQRAAIQRLREVGAGGQGVELTDEACAFLVCTAARDLGLDKFLHGAVPEFPEFFSDARPSDLRIPGRSFTADLEALAATTSDVDSYFLCLGKLLKARLKYQRILETQPIPTMEQVGPRGLLQYGQLSTSGLAGLLYWRKWFFDLDNRAGQETGYLFEPIIAFSIGGTPISATKSPIKRCSNNKKGRQVDCIVDKFAYEIKLRVTIAASGQGRWREELDYPLDCKASGYTPVLVVLDGTVNPKLSELIAAFDAAGGIAYVGAAAWGHLESRAGKTMAVFLEKYVRRSIDDLIAVADQDLPRFCVREVAGAVYMSVGDEEIRIDRAEDAGASDDPELPADIDEEMGQF